MKTDRSQRSQRGSPAMPVTLADIVARHPFPEYQNWWPVGPDFIRFMARAIREPWTALPGHSGDVAPVQARAADYIRTLYQRPTEPDLARIFIERPEARAWQSGEFDALSYAFYRHAFELLAQNAPPETLAARRRDFTRSVGRAFFDQMADFLALSLPHGLETAAQFGILQEAIGRIGAFLLAQGYLRDHFAFRFDVDARRGGRVIHQTQADFLSHLRRGQAYALYEMGYPIILPSAVYLFHIAGEAQHHSSRTVEELFRRIGYRASETDDFDPTGFPAHLVVELWEIRK